MLVCRIDSTLLGGTLMMSDGIVGFDGISSFSFVDTLSGLI